MKSPNTECVKCCKPSYCSHWAFQGLLCFSTRLKCFSTWAPIEAFALGNELGVLEIFEIFEIFETFEKILKVLKSLKFLKCLAMLSNAKTKKFWG